MPEPGTAQQQAWMGLAIEAARLAGSAGEIPVGAVITDAHGAVLAVDGNRRERSGDPTDHAELIVLRAAAAARGGWNLADCTLTVTLEPCPMCAGAILAAHLGRLVYGAWDEKAGAVGSVYDLLRDRRLPQRVEVVAGVRAEECAAPLREFFASRR